MTMAWCTAAVSFSKREWRITAMSGLDWVILGVLALAALATVIWTWLSLDPSRPKFVRLAVTSLRALSVLTGFGLLLQPTLHLRKLKADTARIAVLVDTSGSMTRGGDQSRLMSVKRLIGQAHTRFNDLEKRFQIVWYEFSDSMVALPDPGHLGEMQRPGKKTDIAGALKMLVMSAEEAAINGIAVISDGADTEIGKKSDGSLEMGFLKDIAIPVNTVAIGDSMNRRDLAISHIEAPPFAFTRSETPITVTVNSVGFHDLSLEAFIKQDGVVLQRRTVKMAGREGRFKFTLLPTTLGAQVLEVTVPVPDGDVIPENNRQEVTFEVIRDKIRILHLAGRPSWDQRFLRDIFKSWPNLDLVSFYVLRSAYQSATEGSAGMALIPFPTDELFKDHLSEFDILVFHEFEPAAVGVETYGDKIAEFVKQGGALVLIAGEIGLKSGTMGGKGLEEVLPVRLLPPGTPSNRLTDDAPFKPKLTDDGARHPITRFHEVEEESKQIWRSLPRMEGIGRVAGLMPDAHSLVEHPILQAEDGLAPLLAVREVGKGRTLAITSDELWRWRFTGPMGGGPSDVYASLWKSAVAWLTDAPELKRLRLSVAPSPITLREKAGIDVELLDEAYRPLSGEEVSLTLSSVGSDGIAASESLKVKVDAEGKYHMDWFPKVAAAHTITAVSKSALRSSKRFLVVSDDREIYHLESKPSLLRDMAQVTGGSFSENRIDPERFAINPAAGRNVLAQYAISLWDHPIFILIFLSLIISEWMMRRRLGLR